MAPNDFFNGLLVIASEESVFRPARSPTCGIPSSMTSTQQAPPDQPALVLQRWNSWVRVFLPQTGETRWVDLERANHRPATGAETGRSPGGQPR